MQGCSLFEFKASRVVAGQVGGAQAALNPCTGVSFGVLQLKLKTERHVLSPQEAFCEVFMLAAVRAFA